jgi:hypothetical protein
MIEISEHERGCRFAVKVHPRSRRNAVAGELDGALKLAVTAPPVEGKANAACIDLLSSLLKVSRSSITMAAGETSRRKIVQVTGLSAAEIRQRLGR